MHDTRAPAKGCRILSRDGESWTFADLGELARTLAAQRPHANRADLAWHLREMGYVDAFATRAEPVLDAGGDRIGTRYAPLGSYVVRMDDGSPVAIGEVVRLGRPRIERRRHPMPAFREGPVPRTGHRGAYRGFRSMRTAQERREGRFRADAVEAHDVRPKGRVRDVPSSWDDVNRRNERSWKAFRANRWREA